MSDHHVPPSNCPNCGHKFDGAMNANDGNEKAPKTGDLTVCIRCAAILAFTEDLTVRALDEQEKKKIARNRRLSANLKKAQAAVRLVNRVN